MDIETVIAIAKTLRPGFLFAEHYKLKQGFIICYKPNGYLPGKTFSGISWEKVLVSVGWKGYKGHENSLRFMQNVH